MILQALTRHYEDLLADSKLPSFGWNHVKVSYALTIDEQGQLLRAASVRLEEERGNKKVMAPQPMELPAPYKRSVNIKANFLCDNATYFLGYDDKGKPARTRKCFEASKALHERILSEADSAPARALLSFFRHWEPEKTPEHPALQDVLDDIAAGVNLIFQFQGEFVHDDPAVQQAWQSYYNADGDGPAMTCLVTGQHGPVEAIHPSLKGVPGAQSSGAALVSFNAPAFCSYGREQNFNAPTGKYAAFAYTAALNDLLAGREHVFQVGDTTVVCWAEGGDPAYQDALCSFLNTYSEDDLRKKVHALLRGEHIRFNQTLLNPNCPFYILGLAPNAARLSVRFFLPNSFGAFLRNVQAHYDRLEIVKPEFDPFGTLPLWKLLSETVNQNARDKSPSPNMAGAALRSILLDEPYPATLLNNALLRIRAERKVTRGRAAIIKAYYLKRPHPDIEEVLTVSRIPDSKNPYYTLGRLFAVLEAVQSAANPGINATIKDRYFNSASSMPGHIFPVLLNLSQKHLRKLEGGLRVYYEKQIAQLLDVFDDQFPSQPLSLPQQGAFQLGYYHETQARYQKKEDSENA